MQPLRAYDSEEIAVIDNVGLLDFENRINMLSLLIGV